MIKVSSEKGQFLFGLVLQAEKHVSGIFFKNFNSEVDICFYRLMTSKKLSKKRDYCRKYAFLRKAETKNAVL